MGKKIDGIHLSEDEERMAEDLGIEDYLEDDEECKLCGGTGEVSTMERVYPNEPHMADIGTQKCICQLNEDEYEPE